MSEKLKVCAYARVSTGSEEQETSYKNQLSYFEREITKQEHEFAGIYADKGLTGTKLERKEFEKMLIDAGIDIFKLNSGKNDIRNFKKHTVYEISNREPLFNEIWIKNTSRFARNTLSFELIEKLRNKNVYIYFVEQNLNTRDIGQDLILKIFQMFDEQDSRDKSLKVLSGVKESAKKNVIRTISTIYGYKYFPIPENKLEIIEDEAEVIKVIFDLYCNGYGYRRIINYLTENKIFTRQGKEFAQNTIRSILQNEKYYGVNPILKYDSGIVFNKKSPVIKDEYEIKENDKIPAIITKEQFELCKQIRKKNTNKGSNKGVYHGTTKYANMLICGNCHSYYVANVDNGRKFYNCRTKKKKGINACNNENISLKKLEGLITSEEYNGKVGYIKNKTTQSLNNWIKSIKATRNNNCSNEILKFENKKKTLNDSIENLVKQSMTSVNDTVRNIINKQMENLVIEIDKIDKEIEKLNDWDNYINNSIVDIQQTINQIEKIEIKEKYSEDELFEQIHKIIINDVNNILIHYNIEDKITNLLNKYNIVDNQYLFHLKDSFYEAISK